MAFNLATTLQAIRNSTGDTISPYRFPDTEVYGWIWEAQAEIIRRHPESVPADTTIASTPLVSQGYIAAITAYGASKALMDDAEKGSIEKALAFMQMFDSMTK